MTINTTFILFFIIYAVVLLVGGWYTRRWVTDNSDYILAGREVSLLINVFGIAAIGFAGTIITLGPGLAVSFGFWGSMAFTLAYCVGGLALYGVIFAPYIRRCGAHTLPEWLEMRYDSKTRTLVTFATILGLLGILANNIVSMATVVAGFTGWPVYLTVSAIFVLFLIFTYIGGLWAVTLTDFVQMCIGLVALPILFFTVLSKFGGFDFIAANWPHAGGVFSGGIAGSTLPVLTTKHPSVLTFIVLFSAFLVWGNNYYWIRVSSSRSERVARRAFIYAALLLIAVPYMILLILGLFAGSAFPQSFIPLGGEVSPMATFGFILRELPISIAALMLVTSLAASVSTSTTAHMGATSTAVRDIYSRLFKPEATARELVKPSRYIMLGLGVLVWLMTFYPGGPLYLFAFANAWLGPPSLLVLTGVFWRKTTAAAAFYSALIGMVTMAVLTILDLAGIFSIAQYMHVGVAGLIVTGIPLIVLTFVTESKYYGSKNWQLSSTSGKKEEIELEEMDLQVLDLLNKGYKTMSEISDMLNVDSSISNSVIEKLDRYGYIQRKSLNGVGFYEFKLTEKGRENLPELSDEDRKLTEYNLTALEVEIMKKLQQGNKAFNGYVKEKKLTSLEISTIISKLIREGYLNEGGLWRRKIDLTQKTHNFINENTVISG